MASPHYNTQYLNYWCSDPRDILLSAQHDSLSSKYSGISICHPIYDEKAMTLALRHAIYSAILIQRLRPPSSYLQPPILTQPGNCSPSAYLGLTGYYSLEYSCMSPLEQPEPYLDPRFSQRYSRSQVARSKCEQRLHP
eukprot:1137819-Pelagomonas_calceolata.AAC.1